MAKVQERDWKTEKFYLAIETNAKGINLTVRGEDVYSMAIVLETSPVVFKYTFKDEGGMVTSYNQLGFIGPFYKWQGVRGRPKKTGKQG